MRFLIDWLPTIIMGLTFLVLYVVFSRSIREKSSVMSEKETSDWMKVELRRLRIVELVIVLSLCVSILFDLPIFFGLEAKHALLAYLLVKLGSGRVADFYHRKNGGTESH